MVRTSAIPEIDISGPDRQVGSLLNGDDVEKLREAINWIRHHRGYRLKEIAQDCGAPDHTVRNFAYRKSVRPDGAVLGRLYKFVVTNRELLPDNYFEGHGHDQSTALKSYLGQPASIDLIKMRGAISETDLKRIYDRYSGYYLCFRQSHRRDTMSVSWLHILPLARKVVPGQESLPLPRFTLFVTYPEAFDLGPTQSYVVVGYGFSHSGRIYLTGQHDGKLQHFILDEAPTRRFTYLQGLFLGASEEDRQPIAAHVVCQYLGGNVSRSHWQDHVGIFSSSKFKDVFDNAEIVMKAIGDAAPLAVEASNA